MQFYIPGTHISIHKHVPHSASFYEVVEEDVLDEDCNTHVRVSDIIIIIIYTIILNFYICIIMTANESMAMSTSQLH